MDRWIDPNVPLGLGFCLCLRVLDWASGQGRGRMTQDLILGAKHDNEKKRAIDFACFCNSCFYLKFLTPACIY